MIIQNGKSILLSKRIQYEKALSVGHGSIIGFRGAKEGIVLFGVNANIGRFCCIESDTNFGDNIIIDDYCAVYSTANVGNNVKLLYGKKIYGKTSVGNNCIIGGDVPEGCTLKDNVTFMGEVAHSHYDPSQDWETTDEPSPCIENGSIVGVNALIVGGINIGKNCYVSAGEILRHDLPDNKVYIKGEVRDIAEFRDLIRTRYISGDSGIEK